MARKIPTILILVAGCLLFRWAVYANTFAPTPTSHFYGDMDGDTFVTGFDGIQMNNFILSKPYSVDTIQPANPGQAWNTGDIDGDRLLTGLDVMLLRDFILFKPINKPDKPWIIENFNLPLTFNPPITWIPFNANVYSTHVVAGFSGRPGISVKAVIEPTSMGTGELTGRSCDPLTDCGVIRDCPALPGSQCALAVTITDWAVSASQGLTESGPFGFALWMDGTGDLDVTLTVSPNPSLDIPAVTITLGVAHF